VGRSLLRSFAYGLAAVALAAACAPTPPTPSVPPPTPTAAAPAAKPAGAPAGDRVNGTVQTADGGKITLGDGHTFTVDDKTRVIRQEHIAAGDLKPGMYVAVTATRQADDTLLATMVNIFPEENRGVAVGQRPMSSGALMTNATIDQVEGDRFTVSFPGGGARIQLAPSATLTRLVLGKAADVQAGSNVSALVVNGVATSITIQ
jgi:hypothetical protein